MPAQRVLNESREYLRLELALVFVVFDSADGFRPTGFSGTGGRMLLVAKGIVKAIDQRKQRLAM